MTKHAKRHFFSILVLVFFGLLAVGTSDTGTSIKTEQANDPKIEALADLQVKKLSWYKGGFDSSMLVNITLVNNGTRDVKDIELTCEHYSNSGTKIDSNTRTIYEIIPAGKTKTIKDFNMGFIHSQARKTNCKLTDLTVQ
jgi:phage-related protein